MKGAGPGSTVISSVYTFADDSLIAEREHATRIMGQAKKLPDPVLKADCETDRYGAAFASVIYDQDERCFKMWYTAYGRATDRCVGDPLESRLKPHRLGYAVSDDGVHWHKPALGLVEIDGKTNHNICDLVHHDGMVRDDHDPDASRRYKRFMYDSSQRSLHMLFSRDGLRWTWPTEKKPLFEGWDVVHDTHSLMGWDDRNGKYVAFLRPPVDLDPHRQRKIGVSMTDDVLRWPAPTIVLEADDNDPGGSRPQQNQRGMDFYGMEGFAYGQGYLGLLNIFDAHLMCEFNDPISIGLAGSPDCIHWNRELRSPLIRVGNPGDFDGGMLFVNCKPVTFGDEIYLYYTGSPVPHAGWCPAHIAVDSDATLAIGLAKLRLDGFTALYTNPYPGRIVTVPITVDGDRMFVNCAPDKRNAGWLRIELQDESGHGIDGFSRQNCEPITRDSLYNEVRWHNGRRLAELRGRSVRVCIYQWETAFYAFRFGC